MISLCMLRPVLHLNWFVQVAHQYGLTVSLSKTKGLAVRAVIGRDAVSAVEVEGGELEKVTDFTCLGCSLSNDEEVAGKLGCQIAKASKTFGCLRIPIFLNKTLAIFTKRTAYSAAVLSILLYSSDIWI